MEKNPLSSEVHPSKIDLKVLLPGLMYAYLGEDERIRIEKEGERVAEGSEREEPGVDNASGETEVMNSDDGTEVVSEGKQGEEGQVVNQGDSDPESECREIMKKPTAVTQAKVVENMERAERRARRLSRKNSGAEFSKEAVLEKEKMDVDPSTEEKDEVEISLKRRTRASKPTDPVAPAPEEPVVPSPIIPAAPEVQAILATPVEESTQVKEAQDEQGSIPAADQEIPREASNENKEEAPEEVEEEDDGDEERKKEKKEKGKAVCQTDQEEDQKGQSYSDDPGAHPSTLQVHS